MYNNNVHDKSMANCSQKAWKESTQPDGFAFGISGCMEVPQRWQEGWRHRYTERGNRRDFSTEDVRTLDY